MAFGREIKPNEAIALADVPVVTVEEFVEGTIWSVEDGGRIAALFGAPHEGCVRLFVVIAHDGRGTVAVASMDPPDEGYPSITATCNQAHWFEREITEQWGITPRGHPWLKPIRFEPSRRAGKPSGRPGIGIAPFFTVAGEEVHEVAVGPVHAGVIEPGHFRFQCVGETVFHLEISLGYQHRGIEAFLPHSPARRRMPILEAAAGDTTIGHGTAYCRAMEALGHVEAPVRAEILRGVMLELERLANHTGDLGALAGDVGFLPTLSFCGRLRGDFLNLSALICGSRFGRGFLVPGGAHFDLDPQRMETFRTRLHDIHRDVRGAVDLLLDSGSVLSRFEGTGIVTQAVALELGLVGVAMRAAGIPRDVRQDYPAGLYNSVKTSAVIHPGGDVLARATVRSEEVDASVDIIADGLSKLERTQGELTVQMPKTLRPQAMVVSMVEGWRGEVCHVAMTDKQGDIDFYKIVDPSFHNWIGLAMALRGEQISDFPLCNKSFNLSYCGHDL
ncbi:MAG: hydrogenase [Deltaproteobacteria bacterium]|nr:hydrogenase [Deltaproteobacteria bacterium]